ncbi:uncharacterized protein NECHADRAFT_81644 [Fusarium vanettenii 77-13-4]|uniref:BZIP domain-containing protein n=1 Tax=Fusarium vanettenii (strain ATCC MYA-4622 / CBS 123669 / FGSC 9596 / NRRL 45880 / 77-13-4) TaxID=660122 RepID=C7Z8V6_FUSV7|nr:uncharacterized protein NECHADRAFT_81644 [Fusarium vanettenii 77-13-4]EEU39039.1 hypothetical protein NECHADRAFT_81644 [Fusarium vanettenii 77-13-4]
MGSAKKNKASTSDMSEDAVKDRRLKKRELDRKAQRMARERTKNRITHLEAVVAHLKQGDTDSRILSLMNHLSQVTSERDKLLSAMESLSFVIRSHIQDATGGADRDVSSSAVEDIPALPAQNHDAAETVSFPDTQAPSIPPADTFMDLLDPQLWLDSELGLPASGTGLGNGDISDDFSGDPYSSQEMVLVPTLLDTLPWDMSPREDVIVPPSTPECSCATSEDTNLWRAANEALTRSCWDTRQEPTMENSNGEDVVIRAITEGWESVESRGIMIESWYGLRKVDDMFWHKCQPTERLAILILISWMIEHSRGHSSKRQASLPRWLRARPSQTLPHSRAIDFFAWPGLRERFVFFQHQYCANLFWYLFLSNFKILWPFDFRDTYMQNSETGQFHLSPHFKQCMGDLSSWTIGQGFFEQFPELYADIQIHAAS